ncbi:hypothetical protein [Alicyclobacillus sendaiensis]|uniref:CHAD domain-containing protein n=1 Tax=Alicyclobacillus sendaiensis PA2 TaxID=3029425 RepID=A0ABT6Y1B3_ALISE|nr:hypothetical protein [Alicyclobacillus sendaiensis]MDI9261144.1 hypothetical protein [Alicyclobacillus sendaiensis PA2]
MLRGVEHVPLDADGASAAWALERFARLEVASARLLAAAVRADAGSTGLAALEHHESLRCLGRRITRVCRQMWSVWPAPEEEAHARLARAAAQWEAFRWECEAMEAALDRAARAGRALDWQEAREQLSMLFRFVQLVDMRVDESGVEELNATWRRAKHGLLERMEGALGPPRPTWRAQGAMRPFWGSESRVPRIERDPAHHLWLPQERKEGRRAMRSGSRRQPNR